MVENGSPVVLKSTVGHRVMVWCLVSPLLFALAISALVWGQRGFSLLLFSTGCAWLTLLRQLAKAITFNSSGVMVRSVLHQYWYDAADIERIAVARAGRTVILRLVDGSDHRVDLLDWNISPHSADRRARVVARLSAIRDVSYEIVESDSGVVEPFRLHLETGGVGRIDGPSPGARAVAPVRWPEWVAVIVTFVSCISLASLGT